MTLSSENDRPPGTPFSRGRAAHAVMVVVLIILSLWHALFALVNFSYVEELPENLDVFVEGTAALVAGVSLLLAAARHLQRRRWAPIAIGGACVFATGMGVSVTSGASTPEMFQVVVPALLIAGIRLVVEARGRTAGHRTGEQRTEA